MASASEIYQRAIMQLAAEAAGHGALAAPTASVLVDNPLCGDRVRIDIQIEEGRLRALAHEVKQPLTEKSETTETVTAKQ